jgi:hypothetical protein
VQELPAASVDPTEGQVPNATVKAPLTLNAVNVTGAAEVFITLTLEVALEPTFTAPKLTELGLSVIGAADELPIKLMNSSESVASLWISSVPLRIVAELAFVGVNVTVTPQVAPGRTVAQVVVAVKSAAGSTEATWIVVVPVFVSVTVCAAEALPTCVFANVRALLLSAYAASTAELAGLLDAIGSTKPLNATNCGLAAASLSILRLPTSFRVPLVLDPVATSSIGAYVIVTIQLAFTASVAAQLLVLRKGGALDSLRIVSGSLPEFVSVSACCDVCPEVTCPKLSGEFGITFPVIVNVPEPVP